MAYVRTKKVGNREYHQLVESRRVDGKPRQTVLMHLGRYYPDVDAAIADIPRRIAMHRRAAQPPRRWRVGGSGRYPSPENERRRREMQTRHADDLEAKLSRLKDLRARGVA